MFIMRREGAMLMSNMRRQEAMWRSILTKRGGNIGEYYEYYVVAASR